MGKAAIPRSLYVKSFKIPQGSQVVLVLDEVDALGALEVQDIAHALDGGRIIILATTNRPNDVAEDLRRPGRLDREVIIISLFLYLLVVAIITVVASIDNSGSSAARNQDFPHSSGMIPHTITHAAIARYACISFFG